MTAIVNLCRVVRTGLHSPLSSVCTRSVIHTQCPLLADSVEKVGHGLRVRKYASEIENLYFLQGLPDSDFT